MMGKKTSAVFFSKWMDKYRGSSESQKVGQGQLERRSIKAPSLLYPWKIKKE
jgi:hypothetical protein